MDLYCHCRGTTKLNTGMHRLIKNTVLNEKFKTYQRIIPVEQSQYQRKPQHWLLLL